MKKKIDWTKPIETWDGIPSRVISDSYRVREGETAKVVQYDFEPFSGLAIVDDYGVCIAAGGVRIKNRTVKREGWVLIWPLPVSRGWAAASEIHATEEDAKRAAHSGAIPCRVEWEE